MQLMAQFFLILSALLTATHVTAALETQFIEQGQLQVDVIKVSRLQDLKLFLNDAQNKTYHSFKALAAGLEPCQQLQFAMNAGMYHPQFSPVGLYIEKGIQYQVLNTQKAAGNFFMQPNGVLAWSDRQAVIQTTQAYQSSNFKAQYATQSGPMLVIDGKINPKFITNSDSLKIRNGVGIKNNQLYFAISRNKVSFYAFAKMFQQQLNIDDALYLDGSISSLYSPTLKRHDAHYRLGPIVAAVQSQCK